MLESSVICITEKALSFYVQSSCAYSSVPCSQVFHNILVFFVIFSHVCDIPTTESVFIVQ